MKSKILLFKLFYLLLVMFMISINGKGQSNCQTAVVFNQNNVSNQYQINDTVFWLQFNATSEQMQIKIVQAVDTPYAQINQMKVYSGNCQQKILIASGDPNNYQSLNLNNLTIGNQYYISFTLFSSNSSYLKITFKEIVNNICSDSISYDINPNYPYDTLWVYHHQHCCTANSIDTANCIYFDICPGFPLLISWNYLQLDSGNYWYDCDSIRYEIKPPSGPIITTPYVPYIQQNLYQYIFSYYIPGDYWIRVTHKDCGHATDSIVNHQFWRVHVLDLPTQTSFTIVDYNNQSQVYHNNDTICIEKEFIIKCLTDPRFSYDTSYSGTTNIGVISHGFQHFFTYYGKNPGFETFYLKTYNACDTVVDSLRLYFTSGLTLQADTVCLGQPSNICASYNCNIWTDPAGYPSYAIGPSTQWVWNFGDGSTQITHDSCVTHIFPHSGSYNVTVRVDSLFDFNLDNYVNFGETAHVNIWVISPPIISGITGNNNNCDTLATYSVTPHYGDMYQWNIDQTWGHFVGSNYNNSVVIDWNSYNSISSFDTWIILKVINGPCISVDSFRVLNCCYHGEATLFASDTINSPITIGSTVSINGQLVINANVVFSHASINMGPEASIFINQNNTCEFYNCNIQAKPCLWMWDGIYITTGNSHVIMDSSCIVEDAINMVVSTNGGDFQLRNSTFKNNYKNVVVSSYNHFDNGPHTGSIYGCTLNGILHLPYNPYQGASTFSGVELTDIKEITIGNENQTENYFTQMICGIHSNNSKINVYNNTFEKLLPIVYPDLNTLDPYQLKNGTAIYAVVPLSIHPFQMNNAINIGGYSNRRNNFIECNKGIYTYRVNSVILNNYFDNMSVGIENKTNQAMNSLVEDNFIYNSCYGIKAMSIVGGYSNYTIRHNHLYYPSVTGINIKSLNSVTISNINLKVNILDNDIVFRNEDYNAIPKYGILIEGCKGINIGWNKIFKTGGKREEFQPMYGISMNQSQFGSVHDNPQLQFLGAGLRTAGSLSGTKFLCNKMIDDYWGILFDEATYIDVQGDLYHGNHNEWLQTNSYDDGFPILSGFRKMGINGSLNFVGKNWYFPNGQIQYDPEIYDFNYPLNGYIYRYQISIDSNNCSTIIHTNPPYNYSKMSRKELFEKIINDEKIYGELQKEYSFLDRKELYDMILNDSSLVFMGENDDYEYEDFFNEYANTDLDYLAQINKLMLLDSIETAKRLIKFLPKENHYQEALKNTLGIYLETFAGDKYDLEEEQYDALYYYANQSPYLFGPGVYIARNMLGLNPDDLSLPFSLLPKLNNKNTSEVKLYPNPTKETVTIERVGIDLPEEVLIKIYDLNGRKILDQKIEVNNNYATIQLGKLTSGIYHLNISNVNGCTIANEKLMINQ